MSAPDTYLGLRAFCDELVRCGLRHACTSPGSRSTPLVLSLVREPGLSTTSHLDERCAGFFALGQAKASGRPVALACTSGTATANFAPAVIEAHEARVPLLILTADRPPELRDVGAGQTIDQLKLYGSAAKWFFDVDDHPATAQRMAWLRQLACRAYWTAADGRPGPVHLNFALREPLVLDAPLPAEEPGGGGRPGGRPWVARRSGPAAPPAGVVDELASALDAAERPLLVAGRDERLPSPGPVIAGFAARAGIPLLADPLSGARHGSAAIAHYDALLRAPAPARELAPDLVVRFGDLPTSKPLRALLHAGTAVQWAFDPEAAWQDPAAAVSVIARADPAATLRALGTPADGRWSEWLAAWRGADGAAARAIEETLGDELSEPRVAAGLMASLPAEATLVVGSSMPVRDLETFAAATAGAGPRVLANRGANGIDGTVSTAFGVDAASAGPTVLLCGDVTLLHDLGGLLAARRTAASLTIVLVHNGGGGIFSFLPVAREADAFEEHVATAHGIEFAHAARLFGLEHTVARTPQELRAAVTAGLGAPGTRIVEVRTERAANVELHRRVWAAVAAHTAPSPRA